MTLATRLTIARLVMAPLFAFFLLRETRTSLWIASSLFLLAALTDTVDGWLARRTGTVTPLGRILDPLADKLLVALAYVGFLWMGVSGVKAWMVAAILGRELLVTGLRPLVGRRGLVIHSSLLAKWKTTLQMAVVFGLLALMSWRAARDPSPAFWKDPGEPWGTVLAVALVATVAITVLSGLDYLWKSRTALADAAARERP